MAFKIAGTMAFKEAARKAKPVLLEPIMAVEVVTPEDYMGDVMGDLSLAAVSRRQRAAGQRHSHPGGGARSRRCSATLPTSVRAPRVGPTYTMQFDSYQQMPSNIQEEIVARLRGE